MEILSPSKIHKEIVSEIPFKEWMQMMELEYQKRINSGEISKNIDFKFWLNTYFDNAMLNADGTIFQNIGDILKKGAEKVTTTVSPQTTENQEIVKPKKTFLGLNMPIALSVGGLVLLGIGTLIYIQYRKYKKS